MAQVSVAHRVLHGTRVEFNATSLGSLAPPFADGGPGADERCSPNETAKPRSPGSARFGGPMNRARALTLTVLFAAACGGAAPDEAARNTTGSDEARDAGSIDATGTSPGAPRVDTSGPSASTDASSSACQNPPEEGPISPCTKPIPDRTAERLADMPFQSLDRGALRADIRSQSWGYPTATKSVPNNFGVGRTYNEGHEGADIGGATGDAVVAASAGTVVYVLSTCPNDNAGRNRICGNGWGKHVVVRHAGQVYTRYAHLSSVAVQVGEVVELGKRLGSLGNSGLSDGPHLHYELGTRERSFDVCAGPQNFDKVYNPAVLPYGQAPQLPIRCQITAPSAKVRSSPNGCVVEELNIGATVEATRLDGMWYAVSFTSGGKTWGTAQAPAFVHSSRVACR